VSSTRSSSQDKPFGGLTVVFTGRLLTLDRHEARAVAELLGGTVAGDVTPDTNVLIVGSMPIPPGRRTVEAPGETTADVTQSLRRAEQINDAAPDHIRIVSEDEFCRLAGVPSPTELRQQYYAKRDLLERYRHLREDHLRYLQKWGLIRPAFCTHSVVLYNFPDLGVLKQADGEVAAGVHFGTVLKSLVAERSGQLAFDFRLDAHPAKVVELKPKQVPPLAALMDAAPDALAVPTSAEQYFMSASSLDDGNPAQQDEAAKAYRQALELDPYLVPALINLANIHYARDEIAEAQALYERAAFIEPDVFEAHYNLGNIFHDLARYGEAQRCYREALQLNPTYADAHFYLAVTLEKSGQSKDARPHWRAYQQLAPTGEWVELAKEFSENRTED
jgi:tetratricopeptide (TPR) repeat protein